MLSPRKQNAGSDQRPVCRKANHPPVSLHSTAMFKVMDFFFLLVQETLAELTSREFDSIYVALNTNRPIVLAQAANHHLAYLSSDKARAV